MVELGVLEIADLPSFNESCRKVLRLGRELGFNSLEASKLATLFSEVVRPAVNWPVKLFFSLVEESYRIFIEVEFQFSRDAVIPPSLKSYFKVSSEECVEGKCFKFCRELALGSRIPDPEKLRSLREMLLLPSREELLRCLEKKNKDLERSEARVQEALSMVSSSIRYASRIQRSILPAKSFLESISSECFVLWEPRDVVGGDIYWARNWGEGALLILADCTGHGVPGAFMTLISSGALDISLNKVEAGDCGGLIQNMHCHIQEVLNQNSCSIDEGECSDDGLELGVCYLPGNRTQLTYAGAGFPLFISDEEGVRQLKGDRKGIGYRGIPADTVWTNKKVDIRDDMFFYMGSDGIFDQIGGPKGRGFGKKRFRALLESARSSPLSGHGNIIYDELLEYQGAEKRRDDVSAFGFKV
ncbi:SpoIIE family protein phosphatase [Desulfovibrio sp. JC022]|uniref:SpoIIE family protein phosphatase n=1 Tax=Desulfovibrio sp. JC022 TaxID=2593642 RepID=UPI0013D3F39F|nr:SpoIIE family protein phosphatase [Desulfovibrio sp. JC022]